ncbi:MAG: Gfo/Idh/MocA family oxidoreductase [Planctomycetes bacterium]|nr:Gfo/Idh/MocA family oxidoreductase [Planctomycetota bacterium]
MPPAPLPLAMLGQAFMGRAHSNAFRQVGPAFAPTRGLRLKTVAGRDAKALAAFAARYGFEGWTADWREVARDPEIELVDVATPNDLHREMSVTMLEAGKHVLCEKPLAGTLEDARAMRDAAAKSDAKTFVWFNYRRCPAIALARTLVREGRLGAIRHVRARYLQSWGGPETPLLWRFDRDRAGSGAHGDLNAHLVDLARFLTGEEVTRVHGAVAETFVKQRKDPATGKLGESTVDDCVLFLASFEGGATASFEATRLATGHHNGNVIELNGERGSVRFELEDMNVLWFFDGADAPREAGWRRVLATSPEHHPYVDAWWPDGHIIGYEHTFTNQVADVLRVLAGERPLQPLADFADAYETQRVLEAALISAREGCAVNLADVG